jgi:hypothetical protein
MIRILASFVCLALAGCLESAVPLESGAKVSDPALIGFWKSDLDGDPMVATIRQETNGDLVADVQAYWEPGPKAATKHYQIVLAQFDEHRYMSMRDAKLSPGYSLARYVFEGKDRFCLHAAYSERLARDLEQKVIPGQVKPDRHMPTVELSASSEQLRSYFARRGAGAFRDQPGFNEVTPCRP